VDQSVILEHIDRALPRLRALNDSLLAKKGTSRGLLHTDVGDMGETLDAMLSDVNGCRQGKSEGILLLQNSIVVVVVCNMYNRKATLMD